MFQVRATLVAFMGDEEKYPCHMQHKIGDEILFDGEKYIGRLCPDVWPLLTPKVSALHQAGPRYVEPYYYYPFWYAPPSVRDPSKKIYDGLGFRNVLQTHVEPKYHTATLAPSDAYKWPPHPERTVAQKIAFTCPDLRTAALFVLEAFDLSEKGFDVPFFRRQMTILDRVSKKPGIPLDNILDQFTEEEKTGIYPPLVMELMIPLIEELDLLGYMEFRNGNAFVTEKGNAKMDGFRAGLSQEERDALGV